MANDSTHSTKFLFIRTQIQNHPVFQKSQFVGSVSQKNKNKKMPHSSSGKNENLGFPYICRNFTETLRIRAKTARKERNQHKFVREREEDEKFVTPG